MKQWCFEMATEFFKFIHNYKEDSVDSQNQFKSKKKGLEVSCNSINKLVKESSNVSNLNINDANQ